MERPLAMKLPTESRCTVLVSHPLGTISAHFSPAGLCAVHLGATSEVAKERPSSSRMKEWTDRFRAALERYLKGKPEAFDAIPLDLGGATDFRRRVWEAARLVPYGEATSYGDLARRMGLSRGHSRAVGQALGANPVPIVVPCHRFLSRDGTLGGFSGGLHWKRELLRLEGCIS